MVEEQRRLLEQTKQDAGRLGEREANKDDYYLQVDEGSNAMLGRLHHTDTSVHVQCTYIVQTLQTLSLN